MPFKIVIPALLLMAIPLSSQAADFKVCGTNQATAKVPQLMGVKVYYEDPGVCPAIGYSSGATFISQGQQKTISKNGHPKTTKVYVCAAHVLALVWSIPKKVTLLNKQTIVLTSTIDSKTHKVSYSFKITSNSCK